MVGELLRVSRIANDMTIKEASQKSGVSVSFITEIEKQKRKNISVDVLGKLCDAYNIKMSDFFVLDEYHNSIIDQKTKLEVYKLMLLEVLKYYNENSKKYYK